MVADRPWEGKVIQLFGTVLPGFRMWYSSYNKVWGLIQTLYAESQDGLHWSKPSLNNGGSNALFGGQNSGMVSVIHTPQELSKPFKLMVYRGGAFLGFWSTKGTDTSPYPENPLFYNGGDVAQFYWDPFTESYGGTAKELFSLNGVPRRAIRFIHSGNFINWANHPVVLSPDALDDQINAGYYTHFYGLSIFPMGEQYVGLLWVFRARDQAGLYGPVNVQLVSSHDGLNWYREEGNRPPLLDLGPPSSWDGGQIYTASQLVPVGNELWLYYSGCNLEHGSSLTATVCSIGLARASYHRLASLRGNGVVLTQSLDPAGIYLHLNYDASQGSIRVELLRDGAIISGYESQNCLPLVGDSQNQMVTWSGQRDLPEGPYQIKFYLENSAIYAFAVK